MYKTSCAVTSFMDIQGLDSRLVMQEKKRLLEEAMAIGFPAQEHQEFIGILWNSKCFASFAVKFHDSEM